MLPQIPNIRFVARQAGAVNPALLARAYADGLAVLHIAYGIGLGIFQGNQRNLTNGVYLMRKNQQINFGVFRQILILGHHIRKQFLADLQLISALLKGNAINVLMLHRSRLVVLIDLNNIIAALPFGF